MKVNLETNRLLLRPFEMDDAEQMFNGWASDEEVTKYLTWNAHRSIDDTKAILNLWIKQYEKPERLNFGIVLKETNKLIGGIDVVGYIKGVPVIGYTLSRKYWECGYMTEACKKLIEYLFSKGYTKIRIDALVENVASNKVILKCGGRFVETYEAYIESKDIICNINKYYIENN